MSDIQAQTDLFFVRQSMAAAAPPPRAAVGPLTWTRRNLFATPLDTALTILALAIVALIVPPLVRWAMVEQDSTKGDPKGSITISRRYLRDNFGY